LVLHLPAAFWLVSVLQRLTTNLGLTD